MTFGWHAALGGRPACRFVARLTLALFLLRALVPVGYMPDLGALDHGQVRIVICTATGPTALFVDEAGQPLEDQNQGKARHAGADCPFGTAAVQAFVAPTPADALSPRPVTQVFRTPVSDAAAPAPVQGPPLGPRAPPVSLG